jgi:hypothetical protein
MWRIATTVAVAGFAVCVAAAPGLAKRGGGGGGGHPGGGGHHGGGGHFHAAGRAHFSAGRAASHFTVRHGTTRTNVRTTREPAVTTHTNVGTTHEPAETTATHAATTRFTPATSGRLARINADPGHFASRRRFADDSAFRHFLGHGWHHNHHLGWVGPLFWPYAYGDFFYYALWPDDYGYFDPFWAYGYNDIYAGIFSPYDFGDYVQGPRAQSRMTALTQGMNQACGDEAAEVTSWPIDQIHQVVQPNDQQSALLDDLGNAVVKASDAIKSQCPTSVSFTPTGRLAEMQQRLQAMIQAVNIVEPPLAKFYDSLSDEQKARFNEMGAPGNGGGAPNQQSANAANPKAECGGNVIAWPSEKIDSVVRPTDAQRAKLEALQSAATQAADSIKAACPGEEPRTPPSRLAAVGKRLDAVLQAVQTIAPPLQDFYNSLSDDQKARFNTLGPQILAANP